MSFALLCIEVETVATPSADNEIRKKSTQLVEQKLLGEIINQRN